MKIKPALISCLCALGISCAYAANDLIPDVSIPASGQKVVINIAQARLFLFENGSLLASYPVGTGKPRTPTPLGSYRIQSKAYKPTWTIPASIQRERRDGRKSIPYGAPGHPLGPVFVRFGPSLGIHGTSNPSSVPGWPSHGCVRLHNKNALSFAGRVSVGTPVSVIHQRYSLNEDSDGKLWLGVYPNKYNKGDLSGQLRLAVQNWNSTHSNPVDMGTLNAALKKQARMVCLNCQAGEKQPTGELRAINWTQGLADSSQSYSPVDSYGDDLADAYGDDDGSVGEEISVAADDDYIPAPQARVRTHTAGNANAAGAYGAGNVDTSYAAPASNAAVYGSFDNEWTNSWNNSNGQFQTFDDMFHDGGSRGQVIVPAAQ